ncbi:MAG: Carboxylesterase [Holophagaceae bacterium]|nr:Carboxylesterase [Holophagaceae bacterium]
MIAGGWKWVAGLGFGLAVACGGGGSSPSNGTAPQITQQPSPATVSLGQSASFMAAASGDPVPVLQWQSSADGAEWSTVVGATAGTLSTAATTAQEDGRSYRMLAVNAAGTATSQAASLRVLAAGQAVTAQGVVAGNTYSGGQEFLGIPYAKPPVGGLRWKAPQTPESWTGALAATAFRPRCPQLLFQQGQETGAYVGDEDCLYLNVWTPSLSTPTLPVLVFLHGGAHQQGAPDETGQGVQLYNGRRMAATGGAVVVTPEFRVGPLGYLVHPGLDAEGTSGTSGNYGVLDQIQALRWVRDNIARFGGDPTKVLVFGQSAGAVDAGNLLLAPGAAGLFQRVVMESGMPVLKAYSQASSEGSTWVNALGVSGTDAEKVAQLRALPAATLVATETNPLAGGFVQQVWQPVLDSAVFPSAPEAAFAAGQFNQVPVLLGSTADEMSLSVPATVTPAQVTALLTLAVPSAYRDQAKVLYPAGSTNEEARDTYIQVLTDAQFTAGVRRTARALSAWPGSPVWRYFFTHRQAGAYASLEAYHGIDLFYVFNTLDDTAYATLGVKTTADQVVEDALLRYWVAFADQGVPQVAGLPEWPSLGGATDRYLLVGDSLDASSAGVRTDKCDLWDAVR